MTPALAPRAESVHVRLFAFVVVLVLMAGASPCLWADTQFFSGNLRTDATVISCGASCTLGGSNTDDDYAQWAAVVDTIKVSSTSTLTATTFSYGGGTSLTGPVVAAGGLEPYLSLFDASGDFLASTYLGTTCPAGANTYSGNCYDVMLDGGTLVAGTYYIAVTDYANMSLAENYGSGTLADGFTGLGSLQAGENLNYAYDVTVTSLVSTPTPEPNFGILTGIAMAGLLLWKSGKLRRGERA